MKYIYPILGAIIIILAFFAVMIRKTEPSASKSSELSEESKSSLFQTKTANELMGAEIPLTTTLESNTILITDTGFSPEKLEVSIGTKIKFINDTNHAVWVASDPHPIHIDLPGFDNVGGSPNRGDIYEYTFNKVGSWKYHDHLNPEFKGIIIVK